MRNKIHSQEFITKWKLFLKDIYRYKVYMDYIVVPSLIGKGTLSYMPLLNYTDRLSDNINDLLELGKDTNYQIRVLNPSYTDFKDNDTVNMRVDISSGDLDFISKNIFNSRKCRNQIKKAEKNAVLSVCNNSDESIQKFYNLYKKNMSQHGTPAFSIEFFYVLNKHIECDFIVTYYNEIPVSSVVVVYDTDISLAMWAGIDSNYLKFSPNHSMYWKVIEIAVSKNKKIFDFGRSGYASATYKFKYQWGAVPIKIDIIKNKSDDIYEKYSFASRIWKKTPLKITEFIGPKLCKYLVDL